MTNKEIEKQKYTTPEFWHYLSPRTTTEYIKNNKRRKRNRIKSIYSVIDRVLDVLIIIMGILIIFFIVALIIG